MAIQQEMRATCIEVEEAAPGDDCDIADHGRLSRSDLELVHRKRMDANRLGFAVLLLFFRRHGRFSRGASEVDPGTVADLARQLGVTVPDHAADLLTDRTVKRHRSEIRTLLEFREATVADGETLTDWLRDHAVADSRDVVQLTGALEQRCREIKIEPPGAERADRMVRAALQAYDERFCSDIHGRLSPATRTRLDALLRPAAGESKAAAKDEPDSPVPTVLMHLRSDPGGPSVNSLQTEFAKLDLVRKLGLPADLFGHARPHEVERYRQRVAVEAPYELRRHAEPFRITALAAFAHLRGRSLTDGLVDLLIEGVLHHCTEMEVDRQYVDSHGQSTVGFAFCRLLGFQLMPRLKAIGSQRLSRPDTGQPDAYPNLQPVLTKPIDWELIRQQYDQMVKYATALRLGTAETEAISRRFTRNNVQHPTYKALSELGRAIKTIFLARYLHSLALRREIHEGLNTIERWNGANDFVYFARRGEMTSNRREDHEISMLSLHLLQNCMVYVNTLMLQEVLAQPHWQGRLTETDLRALTPLMWEHVNPYGRFELDMTTRLPLQ